MLAAARRRRRPRRAAKEDCRVVHDTDGSRVEKYSKELVQKQEEAAAPRRERRPRRAARGGRATQRRAEPQKTDVPQKKVSTKVKFTDRKQHGNQSSREDTVKKNKTGKHSGREDIVKWYFYNEK